jgi:hypothetical protein
MHQGRSALGGTGREEGCANSVHLGPGPSLLLGSTAPRSARCLEPHSDRPTARQPASCSAHQMATMFGAAVLSGLGRRCSRAVGRRSARSIVPLIMMPVLAAARDRGRWQTSQRPHGDLAAAGRPRDGSGGGGAVGDPDAPGQWQRPAAPARGAGSRADSPGGQDTASSAACPIAPCTATGPPLAEPSHSGNCTVQSWVQSRGCPMHRRAGHWRAIKVSATVAVPDCRSARH